MNWLAHVFLSPKQIEYQLGNLLADPLKGKAWEGASEAFVTGLSLHNIIDTYTDSHPLISKSKALLTERGHLKGVVLDILYDHFLSVHWQRYSVSDRARFLEGFRKRALKECGGFPPDAKEVVIRVVENRQLDSYVTMDGVKKAFMRIDNRLSERAKSKDTMMYYLSLIQMHHAELEAMFLSFFPELMDHVQKEMPSLTFEHWK